MIKKSGNNKVFNSIQIACIAWLTNKNYDRNKKFPSCVECFDVCG